MPPHLAAAVAVLTVIVAREQRDASSVAFGEASIDLIETALTDFRLRGPRRQQVVNDLLKTMQELAMLYDALGRHQAALTTLERMQSALKEHGDPDHALQPYGWLQQWYLTSGSVCRHVARSARNPAEWFASADQHLARSKDLAMSSRTLPRPLGIAAANQQINAWLDLAHAADKESAVREKALASATHELEHLDREWLTLTDLDPIHFRSGRLGTRIAGWRTALELGDPSAVEASRAAAGEALGPWVRPRDHEKIQRLERTSVDTGLLTPSSTPLMTDRLWVPDRFPRARVRAHSTSTDTLLDTIGPRRT